jgi:hypothetical protein
VWVPEEGKKVKEEAENGGIWSKYIINMHENNTMKSVEIILRDMGLGRVI